MTGEEYSNVQKYGELWIKKVNQIDLLVLKGLDIYFQGKLQKVQETGDDIVF
jgi:hypothetical protein